MENITEDYLSKKIIGAAIKLMDFPEL